MPWSKEEKKAFNRAYYEKNKERLKEQRTGYFKEYYESGGKKSIIIRNWKNTGLIGDYDAIYDKYIASTHCELCKKPYTDTNKKCMDHCHITGEFRHMCCNSCNNNMLDRTIPSNNTTGIKNVSYNTRDDKWNYKKTFNKQTFRYNRQNKNLVLWVKFYDHIILSKHPELCCDID